MPWETGKVADENFTAWCYGKTGFPFVDAGMRQLLAEGWMHNRVRMVVASFLVKVFTSIGDEVPIGSCNGLRMVISLQISMAGNGLREAALMPHRFIECFNPITQGLKV